MIEYAGLSDTVDVWTGYSYDSIPHLLEKYGPRSVDLVFMDQKLACRYGIYRMSGLGGCRDL